MSAVSAYDAIGQRYGQLEGANRILALMRARSLDTLLRTMPRKGALLELGAGSGVEAAAVAERLEARVTAVEPAPSLARAIEGMARERSLAIEVREETASDALARLNASGARFAGAWSSFALGYDAPLDQLRGPLAGVLNLGAPLVLSLRNVWCLAQPWSIPARASGRYRHKVGDARVAIHHYSPRAARGALAPDFSLDSVEALPALVPPPRYGKGWNRLGRVAGAMERADARVSKRAPFRALGDHSLFVFRRA